LAEQNILVKGIYLDLKSLQKQKFISPMTIAHLFDLPEFRQEVINALKPKLGNTGRIGFPAVLGIYKTREVMQHLESALGVPVFEIPGLPPSIPGIRLHNMLVAAIEDHHGSVNSGMNVVSASVENQRITSVWSEGTSFSSASHYI
jgi:glycerol-3-phosphate dehydrogenase subunit B